jgi:hypothetical protein
MAPKVLICSTTKPSEKTETLPITPKAGEKRDIVMRLGPKEAAHSPLPDLRPGDELKGLIELEVTTDCRRIQQGDCVKQPYTFNPTVRAYVFLADNAKATERERGHAILLHKELVVVTHDAHHHTFVFEPAKTIARTWKAAQSYLIVALDAYHRSAKRGHVLLIGANEKGGVVQDKGRLNIVRVREGEGHSPRQLQTKTLRTRRLPLTKARRVVFSVPVEGLRKNEQLTIGAMLEVQVSGFDYPARISKRLVLADSPDETDTGKGARTLDDVFRGEISEHNGTNCMPGETKRVPAVGVLRVTKNATRTHYVNLVCESADPIYDRMDKSLTLLRGSLTVNRYPAEWMG